MTPATSALLSGALLLCLAPAAEAAAPQSSRLTLTVEVRQNGSTTSLVLGCDPDGGAHPRPVEACDLLRSVDGDLTRLDAPPGTSCVAVYDPHVATASGHWRGRQVFYQRTFTNRCWMSATTGSIFAF
ncbi:SSI family serine proteinase inhibitor [Thermopolyspora sp. NPDC052614]|uniref:SSI family serine proteinase inhibitor n=1 Tax=Thermopolyspora sp. NPDC052614 TaxID=3155682 RepID=UPI00344199C4